MQSSNRFALLQLDDDSTENEKSSSKSEKKGRSGKNAPDQSKGSASNSNTKKRSRRKKLAAQPSNGVNPALEHQQWEEAQRRHDEMNDMSYEEAVKEAIMNSQITFEEEQGARKNNPEPVDTAASRQKGKKNKKGKQGSIKLSLAELQNAEFTNGGIVVASQQPPEPSGPALPVPRKDNKDFFQTSEKEAHRLLQAEKRRELLEQNIKNFSIQDSEPEESDEPLDAETLRLILVDRENEIQQLNEKIKTLERERDKLRHYFEISENKTVAQLNEEVEKLSRLNRELNNSLVDTCIKLEQERSRAHELEKTLAASGRQGRGAQRVSDSEW